MIILPDSRYGFLRLLSLAATALLMLSAAPAERAEALSLINPGAASTAKYASESLTTEVRGGHGGHGGGHGGFHGGGHGFHGGGFRGFHGGGLHRGGFHFGGPRFFRRHLGPRFYVTPAYYGPRCRTIVTYSGLRRVCGWHHHRWHHRHHRWHRRWW